MTATGVFVFSHGWNGDVEDARRQYGLWLDAMAECASVPELLHDEAPGDVVRAVGRGRPANAPAF
jgi:hypothetical protein